MIVLLVAFLSGILTSVSMYWWPQIPTSPHPAEGRVYPLNNHGHYTYMNESEYRLRTRIWWAFPILLAIIAVIQHFIDPFDGQRKRRLYGQPPREFH
jgi:hypothetical protein